MPFQTHEVEHREFLFSNVRVQSVDENPLEKSLTLHAVYAEHEACTITYREVYYSRIKEFVLGKRIVACLDLAPETLLKERYRHILAILEGDCGLGTLAALNEMRRKGFRFFTHFIENREECVVVAVEVSVKT